MKFRSSHLSSCVFCRIVDGKERNPILHKDESYTVFSDIRPASKHHLLVVTNEHIRDVTCLEGTSHVVDEMVAVAKTLLEKDNVDMDDVRWGFHWPPFHLVSHLHLHAIAPASQMSLLSRLVFRHGVWFASPLVAKEWLQEREAKNQGASAAAKRPSQPEVSKRADTEDDVDELTSGLGRMSTKD